MDAPRNGWQAVSFGPKAQGGATIFRRVPWWVANVGIAVAVGIAYFLAGRLGLALLTDAEERRCVLARRGCRHRCTDCARAACTGAGGGCRDDCERRSQSHG